MAEISGSLSIYRYPSALDSGARVSDMPTMSTIHFIGGEKGGVGKSVVARLLAQYFIDRSLPFAAVDADESHGALMRYYGEYSQAADLDAFASADQIMDRALGADRRVLVDLPAQSARALERWMAASDVLGFAEDMSVHLAFWHVTDGGFDSVSLLSQVMDLAKGNPNRHCIVVKNFGRSGNFSQFEDSPERKRLVDSGGRVIELPALDATTMYKIDRYGSSLWAAIHTADEERSLSPMERRRAKLWLDQCYAQFEPLKNVL
jgi:hypothetical protein